MHETTDRVLHDVEYTYGWYRDFLNWLADQDYRARPVGTDLELGDALLRHDVDLSPEAAVEMATLEADLGVSSTYFFLVTSRLYNVRERETRERIRQIERLGHDVGIHFSTHQYWPMDSPPSERAIADRIREEQAVLEGVVDDLSPVVSFHIPPNWVLERSFDAFPSAYQPSLLADIRYVADSNGRWREDPPLSDDRPENLQIVAHPGLWRAEPGTFEDRVVRAITDACRSSREQAKEEFLERVYG